jgi:hypothetical protein
MTPSAKRGEGGLVCNSLRLENTPYLVHRLNTALKRLCKQTTHMDPGIGGGAEPGTGGGGTGGGPPGTGGGGGNFIAQSQATLDLFREHGSFSAFLQVQSVNQQQYADNELVSALAEYLAAKACALSCYAS